jgi:predicted HD phosphohydrolase
LGARSAWLVARHVQAKRYLVAVDPAYRGALSARSVATLDLEGGPLSLSQCRRFEAAPWSTELVTLRRADDEAKDPTRVVPGLERWLPALEARARLTTPTLTTPRR